MVSDVPARAGLTNSNNNPLDAKAAFARRRFHRNSKRE
jgi:hypothetical protein